MSAFDCANNQGLNVLCLLPLRLTIVGAIVNRELVPEAGLEPARLSSRDFKSPMSTIPPHRHSMQNIIHISLHNAKYILHFKLVPPSGIEPLYPGLQSGA